jgi:hypothetical protein
LFALARKRAERGRIWFALTGRSQCLYSLSQIRDVCTIESEGDGGIRTVPISEIGGSEGRSRYFDRNFDPLYDQARGRWLSIAKARQQGRRLPPVVLVQVGDVYFVKDGHHRISVAKALGQRYVEAKVTVWQVAGPLPWEMSTQSRKPGFVDRFLVNARALGRRRIGTDADFETSPDRPSKLSVRAEAAAAGS